MTPDQLLLAVLGPVVLPVRALRWWYAGALWRSDQRHEQREIAQAAELLSYPEPAPQTDQPIPAGLHRAVGARACEMVATRSADYRPRHGFDEVPPSIVVPLRLMDPAARARELVRQLGQSGWWPWADQLDRRLRIRLRAWATAHRHGIPQLLGTFQLRGLLP